MIVTKQEQEAIKRYCEKKGITCSIKKSMLYVYFSMNRVCKFSLLLGGKSESEVYWLKKINNFYLDKGRRFDKKHPDIVKPKKKVYVYVVFFTYEKGTKHGLIEMKSSVKFEYIEDFKNCLDGIKTATGDAMITGYQLMRVDHETV